MFDRSLSPLLWRRLNRYAAVLVAALALAGVCACDSEWETKGFTPPDKPAVSKPASSVRTPGGAPAAEPPAAEPQRTTLQRIEIYGLSADGRAGERDRQMVRVVLFFDGQAAFRRGEMAASAEGLPRRLFVDLEDATIGSRVPTAIPVGSGGLSRVRPFILDQRTARVSFDIEPTTAYRLFPLVHPFRLVMDFRRSEATKNRPFAPSSGRTVVLDPGHGGSEQGAVGPGGLKEAVLTLDIARRVRAALRSTPPRPNVILTRDASRTVSLEERAAIANGYGADLFVSIHLNASASPAEIGGVSTYILDTAGDAQALSLAARENGISEQEVTGLQAILALLYRKEQTTRSLKLAQLIQGRTLGAARAMLPDLVNRGTHRALFFVLIGARMPSVLVEASFITRAPEAAALQKESYRQLLAQGIAQGIIDYLQAEHKAEGGR